MSDRRTIASRLVAVLAALLVVAAVVAGYVRHELLDDQRFSERATQALRDRDIRDVVAREVTDRVVLKADPDLLAARPLIESVTASLVGSSPFAAVYGASIRRLHASLLSGRTSRLQLDLRDAGVVVRSGLARLAPKLASRVDATNVTLRSTRGALDDAASGARTLRRLSWVLLGLAAAAVAAAAVLAPVTREGVRLFGIATGVASVVAVAALSAARAITTHAIAGDDVTRRAASALWGAMLGDLVNLLLLTAAAGAVTAAIAGTRADLPDLQPMLARAWARVSAPPKTDRTRAARASALLVVGILILLDPRVAVETIAAIGGVLLVYAGADELIEVMHRHLPPPTEASAARRARGLVRRALPATVVVLIAAGGIAAFAVGGGVDPPAATAPTDRCNGHVELCGRRLDQVVLPATHNAMSAGDLRGWFSAEQEGSIARQLAAGVRGLLIDAHYGIRVSGGVRTDLTERSERAGDADRALYVKTLGPEGLAAIQRIRDRAIPGNGTPGVYLCHRFCELGATEITSALTAIRDFLVLNPGEVMVMVIEDYVTPEDVVAAFRKSGLASLVYTGPPAGPFPTLRSMIDASQRVVVYAEHHGGAAPWYTAGYGAAIQETPYTFKTPAALTTEARLAASCAPNRGVASAPLFLLNHWVNTDPTPKISSAKAVNTRAALVRRARECQRIRGRLPDLVAVNFYGAGDLFGAVDELNGV
jgi:hypothetical protein